MELLFDAPIAVQIHIVAALSALIFGPVVIFRKSRDRVHKVLGYVWISNIVVAATSSFFISGIGLIGPFSPIHFLSIMALKGVYDGYRFIRLGQIKAHEAAMRSINFWAVGIASAFTLLPGRRVNRLLFEGDEWLGLVAIAIIATLMVYFGFIRGRISRAA